MAILNQSDITKAIQSIFQQNLPGYIITRNEPINVDPNLPRQAGNGWIGIYRGNEGYNAHTIGNMPWLVDVNPRIVVQVVSVLSGSDAENRLQDCIEEIIGVLNDNKRLNNTIAMSLGYDITYQYNDTQDIYFHQATIIINGQVRA